MSQARRDDQHFRRGVVLGLTFAEILLLLIFLLMLILAAKMVTLRHSLDKEREQRSRAEHVAAVLKPILDRVIAGDTKFDITKEWVRIHDENDALNALLQANRDAISLVERRKKQFPNRSTADLTKMIEEELQLGQRFDKDSHDLNPQLPATDARNAFESAAIAGKAAVGKSSSAAEMLGKYATCQAGLNVCKAQNKNLSAQLGGVLPPCWVDSTGKIQYIFDTPLKEDGIWVVDNHVVGREREQAQLNTAAFRFGGPMSSAAFDTAGATIRAYGERNGCRFYVRVMDETNAESKVRYKELLRGVEGVFYKLLVK